MKRKFLSLLLAAVMCLGLAAPAVAASEAGTYNVTEKVQVFQRAFDVDSEEAKVIMSSVIHADTGCNDNCTVGSAFVVYNYDTDTVFYVVPVFSGQECIGTVHMGQDLEVGAVWTSDTTLYDRVFDLPDGNYILYVVGGKLYAESSERTVLLEDMGLSMPSNDTYFAVPYEEKVENFLSQADNICALSNVCAMQDEAYDVGSGSEYLSSSVQPYGSVPEFETEACNITEFMRQGNYNLCWAACIATIVNFKQARRLTAIDVANYFGINYYDKNSPDYYGVPTQMIGVFLQQMGEQYINSYGKVSWSNVKSNIKNGDPFIAVGVLGSGTNVSKHALTVYGYLCKYGDSLDATNERYVTAWEPGLGVKLSIRYNAPTFIYGGYTYAWAESVAPF